MKKLLFIFLTALLLLSCARVGSPVGGKKDTIPPKLIGYNIDTSRVNISQNLKELRLDFDEYVTLDKITKNLIISPPIKKIKKIYPSNLANKSVIIQWSDTLKANTTYNFNFGNSIKDFNENNPLRYFNFAFSTGATIDDNYISGIISNPIPSKDGSSTSSEKSIVIGLYKESDSIDYKKKPYYITMADPDGYYELNYLSPGKYQLLAFEDKNENGIFETGKENVGFLKDKIVIEDHHNISGKNIDLLPSVVPFKYKETKENPGGALMVFEGNPKDIEVKSLHSEIKNLKITHQPFSDSVFVWFNAKKDSIGISQSQKLSFQYLTEKKKDSVSLFYRYNPKNEMKISNPKSGLLPPKTDFAFVSNFALDHIDTEKWTLVSDSISQPFTAKIDATNPFKVIVNSEFKEGKKYALTVPKGSVSSYFDSVQKSYRFDFEADKTENYGSATIHLKNPPTSKFWIQLLNSKNEVLYSKYTKEADIKFDVLKQDTYIVRILVDNNENGYWDPADFDTHTFAEDFYIFKKKISARPLWEIVENWDLKNPSQNGIPTNQPSSDSASSAQKEPSPKK